MVAVGVTKDTTANFSHARVPKVKKIVKKSSGAPRKSRKARGKIPFAANDGSASPKTMPSNRRRRRYWAAKPQLSHQRGKDNAFHLQS